MIQSLPTIASAVIVPDEAIDRRTRPSPSPQGHSSLSQSPSKSFAKRSPPEIAENESKRPRISDDATDGHKEGPSRDDNASGDRTEHGNLSRDGSPVRDGTTNDTQAANAGNEGDGNNEAAAASANTAPTNSAIESHDDNTANGAKENNLSATKEQGRRRNGQVEERKRSKRLFGALIGTLSQSSTKITVAQRRRADIEQKQQTKLKMQAEELDQKRLKRLEVVMSVRRREQKKFDEQMMRTRHSNHLAMANFLYTRTEPKLYYKPWELLPEESERIKIQIEDAEALVTREEEEFYRLRAAEHDDIHMDGDKTEDNDTDDRKSSERAHQDPMDDHVADRSTEPPMKTMAGDADADQDTAMVENKEEEESGDKTYDKNGKRVVDDDDEVKTAAEEHQESDVQEEVKDRGKSEEGEGKMKNESGEGPKDNGDDAADEVLEAGEDTVIY